MTLSPTPHVSTRIGRLIGPTVLGFLLVDAGLAMAYLTIATPVVSGLVPASGRRGSMAIGLGIWSFSLIAGGALLAAGTTRLATIVASVKRRDVGGGPAARALGALSEELAVASNVIPREGMPVPELVVGPFGVAVIHELPSVRRARHGPAGWEARSEDGWEPMDDPLDTCDARRRARSPLAGRCGSRVRRPGLCRPRGERPDAPAVAHVCGHRAQPDPGVDCLVAAAADAHLRSPGSIAGDDAADWHEWRFAATELVGEPGLEPGTSGI